MSLPEEPYTRVERYLAKLAGQDVDIPDRPITRIECYLDYLVNNGGGVPAANAGAHNSVFRGASLGTTVTDAQIDAIAAGTFEGIYIGDYWTIDGVKYRVAGLDTFIGIGDTSLTKHHAVIVPDTTLGTSMMNESAVTEGGYLNSYLKTNTLPGIASSIKAKFGENHVLTYRLSAANGTSSSTAFYDAEVELMSEGQIFGRGAYGTQSQNGMNTRTTYDRFPLFNLSPSFIRNRDTYWLQDIVNATSFSRITYFGAAFYAGANTTLGIRPFFLLGKSS